jgi:hypothetical protein
MTRSFVNRIKVDVCIEKYAKGKKKHQWGNQGVASHSQTVYDCTNEKLWDLLLENIGNLYNCEIQKLLASKFNLQEAQKAISRHTCCYEGISDCIFFQNDVLRPESTITVAVQMKYARHRNSVPKYHSQGSVLLSMMRNTLTAQSKPNPKPKKNPKTRKPTPGPLGVGV